MARIENQRLLVWCNTEEHLKATVFDAVVFALKLELEICFFANAHSEKEKTLLQQRIQLYAELVKKDIPALSVSTLLLEGKLVNLMPELVAKYNSVLLFCGNKMTSYLMKAFYQSGFPFFFSKKENTLAPAFKHVLIPIDYRKTSKEAALWGSYTGRFLNADITLLKAHETDAEQKNKVDTHAAFVKRLYGQFLFTFRIEQGKSNSWGIHQEASKMAEEFDLLIFAGSSNVSVLDQLLEPFEKRLVNSSLKTPILLLNPQKELCILCD
jgi:hypothetical protein